MIEFGKSLRTAREAKGITIEQLAERTHMPAKTIRELENEDFSSFAAPIYGRGFVKLYCGEVGLEPKPFIEEFMEIFNGHRDLTIRDRAPTEPVPTEPVPPEPVPTEPAEPAPAEPAEPAPAEPAEPAPAEPAKLAPQPESGSTPNLGFELPPVTGTEPPTTTFKLSADAPTPVTPADTSFSRYASPIYDEPAEPTCARTFSIPPSAWRLTLLGLALAAILWGAFIGLKALHRSTCGTGDSEPTESSVSAPVATAETVSRPPTAGAKPTPPRKPQKIPPLYIN